MVQTSVLTLQPIMLIYRRGYFVSHYWGCTLIYLPLGDTLGEDGHCAVCYTSPKSFIFTFSYTLAYHFWYVSLLIFLLVGFLGKLSVKPLPIKV